MSHWVEEGRGCWGRSGWGLALPKGWAWVGPGPQGRVRWGQEGKKNVKVSKRINLNDKSNPGLMKIISYTICITNRICFVFLCYI